MECKLITLSSGFSIVLLCQDNKLSKHEWPLFMDIFRRSTDNDLPFTPKLIIALFLYFLYC